MSLSSTLASNMYWLPSVTFIAHVAEEYPGFPGWATKHFGATSRAFFVYSHIPLVTVNLLVSVLAASRGDSLWTFFALTIQFILFSNALFHVTTTIVFQEYSPGVVTAVVLFVPSTYYLVTETLRRGSMSRGELGLSFLMGSVLGALIVLSLWLDMNMDWRLGFHASKK